MAIVEKERIGVLRPSFFHVLWHLLDVNLSKGRYTVNWEIMRSTDPHYMAIRHRSMPTELDLEAGLSLSSNDESIEGQ